MHDIAHLYRYPAKRYGTAGAHLEKIQDKHGSLCNPI